MGLDMYLNAARYISHYDYSDRTKAEKAIGEQVVSLIGGAPGPLKFVEVEAMYWRKANQIHTWFVHNVQNGEDECREHDVSREDLTQLRQACRDVLANRERAADVLPTGSGFFFGGTDYDEEYFTDLETTAERIDQLLDPKWEEWNFTYRSSW